VRKPPLVLNQDLADKKKRLKKSMANRAPSSRRRHFGRTRSHFTFNLDEKTSEEDFEFSKRIIRPRRRRIRSPRTRKYAVDLWAYITQNLMAKNERKSQKGNKKEEHNWENMV